MEMILKCKMCGGDIAVSPDMTVGTCLFCGSTMTLPRIDSDKKARLYNRANQYRLNNEFDKSYAAYESIIREDESEAEAYWGLILSEYGVEYVEDPRTKKRTPTCHRTMVKPVRATSNFECACKYADAESRMMYRDEAEEIDRIQRKIIAVSEKEAPYDVFICYKEREDGTEERTQDSVLAQEIYDELERKDIRAFFARITLEDKLGTDYEPYIYSALKSAKVMLVIATTSEHCEAVWVKNEWCRFLAFMEDDPHKTLIPVYRDMSASEFPMELAKFQAQDMGKVGAVQDLVRGIKKILGSSASGTRYSDAALRALLREREEEKFEAKRRHKHKTVAWIIAAAVVVLLGAAGWFYRQSTTEAESADSSPIPFPETSSYEPSNEPISETSTKNDLPQETSAKNDLPQEIVSEQVNITDSSYIFENIVIKAYDDHISVAFDYDVPTECYCGIILNGFENGCGISGKGHMSRDYYSSQGLPIKPETDYVVAVIIGPGKQNQPGVTELKCTFGPEPITTPAYGGSANIIRANTK